MPKFFNMSLMICVTLLLNVRAYMQAFHIGPILYKLDSYDLVHAIYEGTSENKLYSTIQCRPTFE